MVIILSKMTKYSACDNDFIFIALKDIKLSGNAQTIVKPASSILYFYGSNISSTAIIRDAVVLYQRI